MRQAATVMKHLVAISGVALLAGCATGTPMGARGLGHEGYEPFSRAAIPRGLPAATGPSAPIVVAAPAPASDQAGSAEASPEETSRPLTVAPGSRTTAVSTAVKLVGKQKIVLGGKRYGDDCTGLVRGVYAQLGIDLMSAGAAGDNGVTAIYRFAAQHGRVYDGGRPVGGDLVFFRDTFDYNRDGRVNDGLTHIGLVERVEDDGTVIVIHRVARGVVRYKMNLAYRDSATNAEGRPVNDWLRAPSADSKPQLTSQLFAGYATVLPLESRATASATRP